MEQRERTVLVAHYAGMARVGYAGRCRMDLPDDLAGKRVLDLLCRNGKGAYKIADHVGAGGFVLGVDPDSACVERARAGAFDACPDKVGRQRVLAFAQGFPEDMRAVGVEDASFDVVVVNSALNLSWDLDAALREIARVLKPEGLLYHAGLFAVAEPRPSDARRFAARGNVFGAARSRQGFERAAKGAGFACCTFGDGELVAPDGTDVVADGLPAGPFEAVVVCLVKEATTLDSSR